MAILASLRISAATLAICSGAYTFLILAVAQGVSPATANGSLIERNGRVVGSSQIAQAFTGDIWLWPRPSAVDYNASGAGGSNKSPTNPELTERAAELVMKHGATAERPLPAELATASGAGLDPHLTLPAALWQAPRIAMARGLPLAEVERVIAGQSSLLPLGGGQRLVNVLEANLALGIAFPLKSGGG